MDVLGIDKSVVEKVARILKHQDRSSVPRINVFDERFYPARGEDPERVARYLLVMVAMDHRLSRPGKPYEACLEDGCYRGADLLYRLGARMYHEDPEFFSPERLSRIKMEDVRSWLRVGDLVEPPDVPLRTMLLRDLGVKLQKLYNSSVSELINASNSRVRGTLEAPGLVDNLRVFRAYEDPVEKKAMLLAKFLVYRGLFNPVDHVNVAVDNHLTRISLRLGLVMVSGPMWDKIKTGVEFTYEEDVLLRLTVRRAYMYLSERSGYSPAKVDDFFWIMGRTVCLRDSQPLCEKCLFKSTCKARRNTAFMVNEPVYYNTWYY